MHAFQGDHDFFLSFIRYNSIFSAQRMPDFKRGREVNTPLLPLEVMFKILLLIPAEILHSVMRCVCKDWYNIIRDPCFIASHLGRASSCMVVRWQFRSYSKSVQYLDTNGHEIVLKEENFPCETRIINSCNNLWLLHARIHRSFSFYVANPVTKKLLALPFPYKFYNPIAIGLGYAASIGAYKAVCVFQECIRDTFPLLSCLGVLTLGVDKSWRRNDADIISFDDHWQTPFQIKGSIYWITTVSNVIRCLDVDTELYHSFEGPSGLHVSYCQHMAIGDHLGLLRCRGWLSYEVWVAREVKRAGEEWTRFPDINITSPCLDELISKEKRWGLRLVGCLPELFFFQQEDQPKDCFVCNIKTGGISRLEVGDGIWQLFPFVPSLASV